ncbi:hypothetical protein Tco_0226416 [Tanacetum coccineum]
MEREIKRLKRSRIPLVNVRWNSRRGPEFTWEHEDSGKSTSGHQQARPIGPTEVNKARIFKHSAACSDLRVLQIGTRVKVIENQNSVFCDHLLSPPTLTSYTDSRPGSQSLLDRRTPDSSRTPPSPDYIPGLIEDSNIHRQIPQDVGYRALSCGLRSSHFLPIDSLILLSYPDICLPESDPVEDPEELQGDRQGNGMKTGGGGGEESTLASDRLCYCLCTCRETGFPTEGTDAAQIIKIGMKFTARPSGERDRFGFVSTVDAEERRQGIFEKVRGTGIRDTWVDLTEAVSEIAPMTVREVALQETVWMVEGGSLCFREAWAPTRLGLKYSLLSDTASGARGSLFICKRPAELLATAQRAAEDGARRQDQRLGSRYRMLLGTPTVTSSDLCYCILLGDEGRFDVSNQLGKFPEIMILSCGMEPRRSRSARQDQWMKTIELANDLMGQKETPHLQLERQLTTKRMDDDSSRHIHGHHRQILIKRQNVAKKGQMGQPQGIGCFEVLEPQDISIEIVEAEELDGGNGDMHKAGFMQLVNAEKKGKCTRKP